MTTLQFMTVLARMAPSGASIICSPGRTSDEAFDHFPAQSLFLDSMGDVMPLACGVALGLKIHPVIAIDTDGSQLLGLSALPTIGAMKHRLKNLLVVILDNRVYESAGSLPSRYCLLDWSRLGQAFGLNIRIVEAEEELMEALTSAFIELTFLVIQIDNTDSIPPTRKSLDGIESRYLFIRHLERLTDKILLRPSVKS